MVVETTTFRLAPGADEAVFLEADRCVQTGFFHGQPGLLRRTTARSANEEWLVVVLWGSMGDAEAADEAAKSDPAALAFKAMLDEGSLRTKRYTALP